MTDAPYALNFLPKTRHPESAKYSALVFWLLGLNAGSIAKLLLVPNVDLAHRLAIGVCGSIFDERQPAPGLSRWTEIDQV